VREAFRDPEVALVVRAQQHRGPFAEMRRTAADIHRHVPDLTLEDGNVLALRLWPLVMQTAQHAVCGRGHIALHERGAEPLSGEFVVVERFVEESAVVAEDPRLQDHATRQIGFDPLHGTYPRSDNVNRYCP
jgi:hypothetical protein